MSTPSPLYQRPLMPGHGRVYRIPLPWEAWFVDYRAPNGTLYGAWAETLSEAHDWIRSKAKEAAK